MRTPSSSVGLYPWRGARSAASSTSSRRVDLPLFTFIGFGKNFIVFTIDCPGSEDYRSQAPTNQSGRERNHVIEDFLHNRRELRLRLRDRSGREPPRP